MSGVLAEEVSLKIRSMPRESSGMIIFMIFASCFSGEHQRIRKGMD